MCKPSPIFLWFICAALNAHTQELLPDAIQVFLVKGSAGTSLSLPHELARLDSLQEKAMDSLHKIRPWFTYQVVDSPVHTTAPALSLDLCYEIVNNENAAVRNIAMGMSADAFHYSMQRKTLDGTTQKSLSSSTMIMKDLEGYLQPGPLLDILYRDICKKLATEINTYVIETRKVLAPKTLANVNLSIDYRGFTGPAALSARNTLIINGIINNILVAGQQNYAFNIIPSWKGTAGSPAVKTDSLISLALTATDTAGVITLQLDFSAAYPLVFQVSIDRNPAKLGGPVLRTFTISKNDLESTNYSALTFRICRSMNKFFLLNIPPGN